MGRWEQLRYDSTQDFLLVLRADGSTVIVPPTVSAFRPLAVDTEIEAHRLVRPWVTGENPARLWKFRHDDQPPVLIESEDVARV